MRAALSDTDCIYFSGITLAILSPERRSVFLAILSERKLAGATIAFDTNSRRRLWSSEAEMQTAMIDGYKVSTLALPTFDDERAVFGDSNPEDCLKRIAGYGVQEIVIKNGSSPCLVFASNKQSSVAPEPVQNLVDTTGAGDSFNSGYVAARLSNISPIDAAKFAQRVAGRVIGGHGALLNMAEFKNLALN